MAFTKRPAPELPAEAQGTHTAPVAPLRDDVYALIESIALEKGLPFRAQWATFVQEYLVDANAARAAQAAGYSEQYDKGQGMRMVRHPVVGEAIRRLQRERHAQLRVEADDVLLNLVRIASFDPRTLVYKGGKNKDGSPRRGQFRGLVSLKADTAACISAVDFDAAGHVTKLRFWNKNHALEVLARHLGLLSGQDASAQLPGGVGALLTLLQPGTLARLTDAEVEAVAGVLAIAKRVVAQAERPALPESRR